MPDRTFQYNWFELKKRFVKHGWPSRKFAKACQIPVSTLNRIIFPLVERTHMGFYIREATFRRIAQVLGTNYQKLTDYHIAKQPGSLRVPDFIKEMKALTGKEYNAGWNTVQDALGLPQHINCADLNKTLEELRGVKVWEDRESVAIGEAAFLLSDPEVHEIDVWESRAGDNDFDRFNTYQYGDGSLTKEEYKRLSKNYRELAGYEDGSDVLREKIYKSVVLQKYRKQRRALTAKEDSYVAAEERLQGTRRWHYSRKGFLR